MRLVMDYLFLPGLGLARSEKPRSHALSVAGYVAENGGVEGSELGKGKALVLGPV